MERTRMNWKAVAAGALLGAVACAGNPPPVALHSDAEGLERLRGQWQGEYWSEETGRQGTIRFELTATGDTARGAVMMIPAGRREALQPFSTGEEEQDPTYGTGHPQYLTIHFVHCREGHVQGTLDAYRDPETGHPLVTTFHGEVFADSISGTYSSYDRTTERSYEGAWHVRRR